MVGRSPLGAAEADAAVGQNRARRSPEWGTKLVRERVVACRMRAAGWGHESDR